MTRAEEIQEQAIDKFAATTARFDFEEAERALRIAFALAVLEEAGVGPDGSDRAS